MAYTTIDNPELYFQAKTYTGNDTDDHAITLDGDEDMSPNLVWIKSRALTHNHQIHDTIRGATKHISSDVDNAQATEATGLKSFDSDGFTLGTWDSVNVASNGTYIAWCWKASGSTASNTNGTNITSTVDANTTSGFSIISWTGDNSGSSTVGHGLGKTPEFLNIKNLADAADWQTKHKDFATNTSTELNNNGAPSNRVGSTNGGIANFSGTTTFGFIAGSAGVPAANGASDAMIAYAWNSVKGFSKIGIYEGNGNADGPFIFCGFRPAWFMTRRTDSTGDWRIRDVKREPGQPLDAPHYANTSIAENDGDNDWDVVSNGLKMRGTGTGENADGGTYVYIAFAEAPFVNSEGVPCNAR